MSIDDWDDDFFIDDDYYDEYENDDESYDPCNHCGPACEHWGGDNLCMLEIEEQAKELEEYEKNYIHKNVKCPVCGAILTQYDSPSDELWIWPADYSPFIPLYIYGVYDYPKGEIHHKDNIYHIFVGLGQNKAEKLICLKDKRINESSD